MSKYEKDIQNLNVFLKISTTSNIYVSHNVLINYSELVERVTPKKVIYNECVNVAGNCPVCNGIIEEGHQYKFHRDEGKIDFCPHCGQALDWSDDSE